MASMNWRWKAMLVCVAALAAGALLFGVRTVLDERNRSKELHRWEATRERIRAESRRRHPSCFACDIHVVESVHLERALGAYVPPTQLSELPSYDRCAVVFPSALLEGFTFGAEIDEHDAVFRVNADFDEDRDEVFAGRKTSVRVCNRHLNGGTRYHVAKGVKYPYVTVHMRDVLRDGEIAILRSGHAIDWPIGTLEQSIGVVEPADDFERTVEAVRRANKSTFINSHAYRVNQRQCQNEVRANARLPDWTSGFDALRFARAMCHHVTIYGAGNHSSGYINKERSDLGRSTWHDHVYEPRMIADYCGVTAAHLVEHGKSTLPGCR
jgi:Glycosyltransferase family 29 (sialyltransferase)